MDTSFVLERGFSRTPEQVMAGFGIGSDVGHFLAALTGRRASGRVDTPVQFLVAGRSDVNDRDDAAFLQEEKVVVRIVLGVCHQEHGAKPSMGLLDLLYDIRQERVFVGVGGGEYETKGNP